MTTDTKRKNVKQSLPERWRIIKIILLGVWVLFQYRQGNELYAVFMIFFSAILSIIRLKNFILIATATLVIVLFKAPVLNTWTEIKASNLETFQTFKPSISKVFMPNSGNEILSNNVKRMLSLLHENGIAEYRICNSFREDPLTNQRIVESAWPIRLEPTSKYLLCPMEEIKTITGCNEIANLKDVSLAYCP